MQKYGLNETHQPKICGCVCLSSTCYNNRWNRRKVRVAEKSERKALGEGKKGRSVAHTYTHTHTHIYTRRVRRVKATKHIRMLFFFFRLHAIETLKTLLVFVKVAKQKIVRLLEATYESENEKIQKNWREKEHEWVNKWMNEWTDGRKKERNRQIHVFGWTIFFLLCEQKTTESEKKELQQQNHIWHDRNTVTQTHSQAKIQQ